VQTVSDVVSLDWYEADGIILGVGDKVTEIQTDRYRATAYNVIARRRAVKTNLRPTKYGLVFVTGLDLASSNLGLRKLSVYYQTEATLIRTGYASVLEHINIHSTTVTFGISYFFVATLKFLLDYLF